MLEVRCFPQIDIIITLNFTFRRQNVFEVFQKDYRTQVGTNLNLWIAFTFKAAENFEHGLRRQPHFPRSST